MPRIWLIAIAFFTGIIITGLSLPMIFKKVKPNGLYGFRTRKTLSDEAIWYEANTYAGKALLISGIIILIGSVVLYIFIRTLSLNTISLVIMGLILIPVMVTTIVSLLHIRKL